MRKYMRLSGIVAIIATFFAVNIGIAADIPDQMEKVFAQMGYELDSFSFKKIDTKEKISGVEDVFRKQAALVDLSDPDVKLAKAIYQAMLSTQQLSLGFQEPLTYLSWFKMMRYFYNRKEFYSEIKNINIQPKNQVPDNMKFFDYIIHECDAMAANWTCNWKEAAAAFMPEGEQL